MQLRVGDSTAKVVNSEQITTPCTGVAAAPSLVILPQRLLILSKSQRLLSSVIARTVGDSTAKVVNSEQITTTEAYTYTNQELVILPQR